MCHNTDTIYILTTECIFKPHHQSMHKMLTLNLERIHRYHQWATIATQCVREEFLYWNLHLIRIQSDHLSATKATQYQYFHRDQQSSLTTNLFTDFGVVISNESTNTFSGPQ